MNPILYLGLVGTASAGLVFWQQVEINRVHKKATQISQQALDVRPGSAQKTPQMQVNMAIDSKKSASFEDTANPGSEGWWPTDKPYFYLPKAYLSQIRFLKCRLPIAEINKLTLKRESEAMSALTIPGGHITVTSVSVSPDKDGKGVFDYRLVEVGKLNRDMAVLLGMTDQETERVEAAFAELKRAVEALETSRVERVDPPQPYKGDLSQQIVARIPDLSTEVAPLVEDFNAALEQALGKTRAMVLSAHAEQYFKKHSDDLGRLPRTFIYGKSGIEVEFQERWGGRLDWDKSPYERQYPHLFGHGAPCELK